MTDQTFAGKRQAEVAFALGRVGAITCPVLPQLPTLLGWRFNRSIENAIALGSIQNLTIEAHNE